MILKISSSVKKGRTVNARQVFGLMSAQADPIFADFVANSASQAGIETIAIVHGLEMPAQMAPLREAFEADFATDFFCPIRIHCASPNDEPCSCW